MSRNFQQTYGWEDGLPDPRAEEQPQVVIAGLPDPIEVDVACRHCDSQVQLREYRKDGRDWLACLDCGWTREVQP